MNERLCTIVTSALGILLCSSAYAQELNVGGVYECAKAPDFIERLNMSEQVVVDTTLLRRPGVVLRELDGLKRIYQKPSWRLAGNAGGTVRDSVGNIYVMPVPTISLELNPLEKRNTVYKIDNKTGSMSPFINLPMPEKSSQSNPFGTVGMTVDCDTNSLYVSSVAGSSSRDVNGSIYRIDLSSGEIVDEFFGFDAIGLGVFNFTKEKRLYLGDARSSSLFSILLSNNGQFIKGQAPRYELSLLEIKNGNSTQVKKIRFTKSPNNLITMKLSDTDFSYRMQAAAGLQYRHYIYAFDKVKQTWLFEGIE